MSKYASVLCNPEVHSEQPLAIPLHNNNNIIIMMYSLIESILEVLNDPSFERSQPSWLRRSRYEETDGPVEDTGESKAPPAEIKTEFEDEDQGEKVLLTMV